MNGLSNDIAADSDTLDQIFAVSPVMLCIVGTDTSLKRVNPAFQSNLGYSEHDLASRSFSDLVHPDDRDATMDEVRKLANGTKSVRFENRCRHANGSYRWFLWNAGAMAETGLLYATAIDITERKRADKKYRNLKAESARALARNERKLQAMANRLVLAEENERRRIARGLHDDVGQTLLSAKMAVHDLAGTLTDEGVSLAGEVEQLLDHAIQSTRSLTFDLASEALYDLGLGAAMQSLCERAQQQSGIRFQVPQSLQGKPIPESARIILYRVGRELIQNIVKHSNAQTATLSLTLNEGVVRLTVDDDGRGFDVAEQRRSWGTDSGFGLFSIDQQLRPIGGRLEIVSSPASGTCAIVTVPLDAKELAI